MAKLTGPSAVRGNRPGSRIYPTSPIGGSIEGIATGRDVEWEPLLDYRRNGVSETTIHGAVAWATGGKVVHWERERGGDLHRHGDGHWRRLLELRVQRPERLRGLRWRRLLVRKHNAHMRPFGGDRWERRVPVGVHAQLHSERGHRDVRRGR